MPRREPPFRRDTEVATLYRHLEDLPPDVSSRRPNAPAGLDAVLAKAMAKSPSDRFRSAGELSRAASAAIAQPALRPEPPSKRSRYILIGAAALLPLILLIAILARSSPGASHGRSSPSPEPPPLGSAVEIDATSGRTLVTVPGAVTTGESGAVTMAIGEGGVWILGARNNLAVVDPATAELRKVIPITASAGATGVTVGFRTVWVPGNQGLTRIDPATDAELSPVRLPERAAGTEVVAGKEAVWAISTINDLLRVDPATGKVVGSIALNGSPTDLDYGDGAVWILDELQGTLTQVDAATEKTRTVSLPGALNDLAVGAGAVWVLDSSAGTLTMIDPVTMNSERTIRVGEHPVSLAAGLKAVWVANGSDGTISHVNPALGQVDRTIPVGAPVAAVAIDERLGTLWVVVAEATAGD